MSVRCSICGLLLLLAAIFTSCSNCLDETEEPRDLSYYYADVYELADSAEELLNPAVEYGEMKDLRDGKAYKTVKIDGLTWMAQNLDFADSSLVPSIKGASWCYDGKESSCKVAGRLYTWSAAMDLPEKFLDVKYTKSSEYVISNFYRGICPSGWHLPSQEELVNALLAGGIPQKEAGRVHKSVKGWREDGNGLDEFGFSVVPAGIRAGEKYANAGFDAYFWTSTEVSDEWARGMFFSHDSDGVTLNSALVKSVGRSVRCVQDTAEYSGYPASDTLELNAGAYRVDPASVVKGSFVDERDGHVYKTVKIGEYTWFAENLAYLTGDTNSFCYDNVDSLCSKYGRLYRSGVVENVCPDGTHLPTLLEFDALLDAAEKDSWDKWVGKAFKSADSWNGKDDFGFNALPAGGKTDSAFEGLGSEAIFWREYGKRVVAFADTSTRAIDRYGVSAASVRCVLGDVGDYRACNKDAEMEAKPLFEGVDSSYVEGDYLNDLRDNKFYKVLKIGKQTWMTENLNYRHSVYGKSNKCNNDSEVCDSLGALYIWGSAMDEKGVFAPMERFYCKSESVHRGICPKGWHVPTIAEWKELAKAAGDTLVAGDAETTETTFWTSSDYSNEKGKCISLDDLTFSGMRVTLATKKDYYPVRCVMDLPDLQK